MAKISRTAQARTDAARIVGMLDKLDDFSHQAYREALDVHDDGINLARLITGGYVSPVSESGASLLAYVAEMLTVALDHGVKLMLSDVQPHVTIIEQNGDDMQRGLVERKNLNGTAVYVLDRTLINGSWVSLLWAPKSTIIVH